MKKKYLEEEEAFHRLDKKASRRERKILSKKDRSKFKKTDLEKKKKNPIKTDHLKEGRVLAIMADGILVDYQDKIYTCHLRGNLKKETGRIKNLIAVGDFVLFEPYEDFTGSINHVQKRYSILSRAGKHQEQLIAVNIDQVLITMSVASPHLKPNLIDRYIIAALKGNMNPIIVINKIDLLKEGTEEKEFFEEIKLIYEALEFPFFPVSATKNIGITALKKAMEKKSSVFSGQSGTGKSSLINSIIGSNLLTKKIIKKTQKGSHTTTATHLLPIEGGGFCIDTPGIKSFGMWDLKKEDVQKFYFEISHFAQYCKYPNCTHLHEPNCGVKKALEDEEISHLRFDSYCALMASYQEKTKR